MENIVLYLKKISILVILILFYCRTYLAFPNILMQQAKIFSIFFSIFQYWGAGVVFYKFFELNWIQILIYVQLPSILAILFHYSIDYNNVPLNSQVILFIAVYVILLPLCSLTYYLFANYKFIK